MRPAACVHKPWPWTLASACLGERNCSTHRERKFNVVHHRRSTGRRGIVTTPRLTKFGSGFWQFRLPEAQIALHVMSSLQHAGSLCDEAWVHTGRTRISCTAARTTITLVTWRCTHSHCQACANQRPADFIHSCRLYRRAKCRLCRTLHAASSRGGWGQEAPTRLTACPLA
jgi:hypothetical protein